jgi:hypothetical protein
MRGITMKTIRIIAALAAVLLLAGCILQPEGEDTGSISLSIEAPDASVAASAVNLGSGGVTPANVTAARVWVYANGAEYRLAPATGTPSSRNFLETLLTEGRGRIRIDGIPEGDGYSLVIVLGKQDQETSNVFVPVAYARSGRFAVSGGRETTVAPQKVALVGEDDSQLTGARFDLVGESLNSVAYSSSEGWVVTAASDAIYGGPSGSPDELLGNLNLSGINSVALGRDPNGDDKLFLVNADAGLYRVTGSTSADLLTPATVKDVTYSGTFLVEETGQTGQIAVFYQRLGGLGGVISTDGSAPTPADDWQDFGPADLEDLVDPDTSPVRAQVSGDGVGFFATRALDNFMLTEALFDSEQEVEAADLISGEADGVTFFNVPFPGTTRPMRIDHLAIVNVGTNDVQNLVVGTPRGAVVFPTASIGSDDESLFNSETKVVQSGDEGFKSLIRNEPVVALATDPAGRYLAIATDETIAVLDVGEAIPEDRKDAIMFLPRRGAALGQITGLAIEAEDDTSTITLHVAGTEGLVSLTAEK